MKKLNIREVALQTLLDCEFKYQFLNSAIASSLAKSNLSDKDRALCTELVNGTTRWRKKLDWFISRLVDYPVEQLSPKILNILRLAFYQKIFLSKIPDHALVNEAVEMTKTYEPAAASLVNAVLRRFLREYTQMDLPPEADNPIKFLGLKYSFPEWLIERWHQQYTNKELRTLCETLNQPAPLTVRINPNLTTPEELVGVLAEEGVSARRCRYAEFGLTIKKTRTALTSLNSYQEGLFTIQGESSMLIPLLLQVEKGSTVMDFCAGRGGKTSHLAELAGENGRIIAFESDKENLENNQANGKRLKLDNIEAYSVDLTKADKNWHARADYILVDAPCSGLGSLRRYADARWHKNHSLIERMAELQVRILATAASCLKPGGRLLYSVCTNTCEENELVVTSFLKANPRFSVDQLSDSLPPRCQKMVREKIYFRTLPHRDKLDGFFAVRLTKGA